MSEKRYSYDNKTVSLLKDGEFWLDGQIDTACNHSEICAELNEQDKTIKELDKYCSACDDTLFTILELVDILFNENGIVDLNLIYNGLKAIRDVDLEEMNKIIIEAETEDTEKLKKYNKSQELEIIRLHNLADTMSSVLRELGIHDVNNDEQVENAKRRIEENNQLKKENELLKGDIRYCIKYGLW